MNPQSDNPPVERDSSIINKTKLKQDTIERNIPYKPKTNIPIGKIEKPPKPEMELEPLWSNMPIFFEDYGFSITDLNESKKIYYVDFIKPDSSFWDRIWGDDAPVVDIKESSYQFVLAKMGEQTSVTIYDAEGNVLSNDTLKEIMPVMEPGLSFRNVF